MTMMSSTFLWVPLKVTTKLSTFPSLRAISIVLGVAYPIPRIVLSVIISIIQDTPLIIIGN
ncbi:hypothetical protein CR513_01241, partial [Mucuna pruriens]